MSDRRGVFLTGATGFIGSRLARRLAARGDRLRCLVRPGSDASALEALGADIVRGDLLERDTVTLALNDVDLAYHVAGLYDLGPAVDAAALERTNVEGTRAVLAALEDAGTPRAVYVSTTVALGPVGEGIGDAGSRSDRRFRSAYERTKTLAHELARQAQGTGLPLVIACPSYVYGPGDHGPGARFIRDLLKGRLPGLLADPATFSYVHVEDVADGLLRLGEAGRVGETYVLGGEPSTVNEYASRIAALAGKRLPRLRLPTSMARLGARTMDRLARLTGWRSSLSRESIDTTAGLRWLHSWETSRREIGYDPRPLREGLPETVAWFVAEITGTT